MYINRKQKALQTLQKGKEKMPTLQELHDAAMASIDKYDNYNYDEPVTIHWKPVAKIENKDNIKSKQKERD